MLKVALAGSTVTAPAAAVASAVMLFAPRVVVAGAGTAAMAMAMVMEAEKPPSKPKGRLVQVWAGPRAWVVQERAATSGVAALAMLAGPTAPTAPVTAAAGGGEAPGRIPTSDSRPSRIALRSPPTGSERGGPRARRGAGTNACNRACWSADSTSVESCRRCRCPCLWRHESDPSRPATIRTAAPAARAAALAVPEAGAAAGAMRVAVGAAV